MILVKKILKWTGIVLLGLYVLIVLGRAIYFYRVDKTNEQVAKIHSTRLQLSDVMGSNLPSDPGEAADDTVAGIDVNKNGIRDDVELAIFKEYPNSAKTRAALLQYALALQMQMIQDIVNEGTVVAVAQQRSRASFCIGELVPRNNIQNFIDATQKHNNFVTYLQINNQERIKAQESFLGNIGSYSDIQGSVCDIDFSTLPK